MSKKRLFVTLAILVLFVAIAIIGAGIWFFQPRHDTPVNGTAAREDSTNRVYTRRPGRPAINIPERPVPNFPVATDGEIAFTDSTDAGIDERSTFRTFEISQPAGDKHFLTAAHLDEPDWQNDRRDDEALIARLADLNAAFSDEVAIDLPKAGKWEKIRLHIGNFSQDACTDLTAVVSFRSPRVFAITDLGSNEIDFSASKCPLQLAHYVKDKEKYGKRPEPDDFSAFCSVRSECLKTYYGRSENREKLSPAWVANMARIELR